MKHWLVYAIVGCSRRYYCQSARSAQSAKNKVIRDFMKSWEYRNRAYRISIYHVELVTGRQSKALAREVALQEHILDEMREAVVRQEQRLYRLKQEMRAFESAEEE